MSDDACYREVHRLPGQGGNGVILDDAETEKMTEEKCVERHEVPAARKSGTEA